MSSAATVTSQHWQLKEHQFNYMGTSLNGVDLDAVYTLQTPMDRWEHHEFRRRPEHEGGSFSAAYDAYTASSPLRPSGAPGDTNGDGFADLIYADRFGVHHLHLGPDARYA